MQRDLRRPLPYPLVRPLPRHSHVPRGCSKGRSAKVFVLNATRVPPAAWGSPRAFVVNSSTLGFLVWLAGLGRLVLQVFALSYHAIMRRSMPVPTTLRSQGCALATPAADADGFCRLLPDSTSDSSSSFALVRAKQAAPPETFVLHCIRHTTDRMRAQTGQGCPTRVPVWISYFLTPSRYAKRNSTFNQARGNVPLPRHLSQCF